MTDNAWLEPLTPDNPAAPGPRKCLHPRQYRRWQEDGDTVCTRCGKVITATRSRSGRTSRRRGNDIERAVAKQLGMKRTGQYGGPDDARGSMFAAQVKSGGAYPERLHRWLKQVPVDAGQTAILVVTDAPGSGTKRRGLVVLDLADWIALHGEAGL